MFQAFLARRYESVKAQFPGEGRRKWLLRVVEEFFASDPNLGLDLSGTPTDVDITDILNDADPFDDNGPHLGLLIRTDFSNDDAWSSFCERLQATEMDFIQSTLAEDVEMDNGEDDSDSSSLDGIRLPIVKIINPTDQNRALLENLSNLGALRIFTNADVRRAPSPPAGTERISPPNRLIDRNGWQEVYKGIYLWIYDAQSNIDQSARVVRQASDDTAYGTATGDSWRAQVTHIIELQSEIACQAMTINFGGLDRYDYNERRRNMDEAER